MHIGWSALATPFRWAWNRIKGRPTVQADRSMAAGGNQTLRGAVVTAQTGAAASEGGAVATSGAVAVGGSGPTIVVQPGAALTINYYADGLPQAAPEVRNHFREGQRLQEAHEHDKAIAEFEAALSTADTDSRRGALHLHIGVSHYLSRRLPQAEGSSTEALRLFRAAADEEGQATALGNLGVVYAMGGDPDRAEEHLQQAVQIFRRIDSPSGEAWALTILGLIYLAWRRDLDKAQHHQQQAFELSRRIDNVGGQALALTGLGLVAGQRGRPEEALALYERLGAGGEAPDAVRAALRRLEAAGGEEKP